MVDQRLDKQADEPIGLLSASESGAWPMPISLAAFRIKM
jgi:hypothetical protein